MLIADHLKMNAAPPGSYSWAFIDDSIKKGQLQERDNYLIGRPRDTARPVGSSAPTKRTRTPFTSEDDKILTDWVLLKEKQGGSVQGNEIYKELEEQVSTSSELTPPRMPLTLHLTCSTLITLSSPGGTDGSRNFPFSLDQAGQIPRRSLLHLYPRRPHYGVAPVGGPPRQVLHCRTGQQLLRPDP